MVQKSLDVANKLEKDGIGVEVVRESCEGDSLLSLTFPLVHINKGDLMTYFR
jgi:hypothetical protein